MCGTPLATTPSYPPHGSLCRRHGPIKSRRSVYVLNLATLCSHLFPPEWPSHAKNTWSTSIEDESANRGGLESQAREAVFTVPVLTFEAVSVERVIDAVPVDLVNLMRAHHS